MRFGDFCLGGDGVYLDGVFHEVEVIGNEGFAQGDGDHWGEFAVDFHDEIYIGTCGFAGSGDDFDGVFYDARLRLVLVSACDGIKFDGGEAFGNGGFCVFIHLFGCGAAREQVQANFVAAVATEEFPDRDLEVFAFDVVKGDVHCADCAAKRGAAKRVPCGRGAASDALCAWGFVR